MADDWDSLLELADILDDGDCPSTPEAAALDEESDGRSRSHKPAGLTDRDPWARPAVHTEALNGRSAAPTGQPSTVPVKAQPQTKDDLFFGYRVKNPLMSSAGVRDLLNDACYIPLKDVSHSRASNGLWGTVAVVVEASTGTSVKGSGYGRWRLSDLDQTVVNLMLFGDAFEEHRKVGVGSLLLLYKADMKFDNKGPPSLSIKSPQQLRRIGQAVDHGICKGTTKAGEPCKVAINKSKCEYCVYHAPQALKKLQGKRGELVSESSMFARQLAARVAISAPQVARTLNQTSTSAKAFGLFGNRSAGAVNTSAMTTAEADRALLRAHLQAQQPGAAGQPGTQASFAPGGKRAPAPKVVESRDLSQLVEASKAKMADSKGSRLVMAALKEQQEAAAKAREKAAARKASGDVGAGRQKRQRKMDDFAHSDDGEDELLDVRLPSAAEVRAIEAEQRKKQEAAQRAAAAKEAACQAALQKAAAEQLAAQTAAAQKARAGAAPKAGAGGAAASSRTAQSTAAGGRNGPAVAAAPAVVKQPAEYRAGDEDEAMEIELEIEELDPLCELEAAAASVDGAPTASDPRGNGDGNCSRTVTQPTVSMPSVPGKQSPAGQGDSAPSTSAQQAKRAMLQGRTAAAPPAAAAAASNCTPQPVTPSGAHPDLAAITSSSLQRGADCAASQSQPPPLPSQLSSVNAVKPVGASAVGGAISRGLHQVRPLGDPLAPMSKAAAAEAKRLAALPVGRGERAKALLHAALKARKPAPLPGQPGTGPSAAVLAALTARQQQQQQAGGQRQAAPVAMPVAAMYPATSTAADFRSLFGVTEEAIQQPCESRYQSLVEKEAHASIDKSLSMLEAKDVLAQRIDSVLELKVQAVFCATCSTTTEAVHPVCRNENHTLRKVQATKRWWTCNNCSYHFATVAQLFPSKPCFKCKHVMQSYSKASMYRERKENIDAANNTIASKKHFIAADPFKDAPASTDLGF